MYNMNFVVSFGRKNTMKKGIRFLAGILCILVFHSSATAQSGTTAGPNQLGIRISSSDAVVNNSVTYKHFFRQDLAVEGLLSFGDPVALGVLIEKHKPLGSTAFTWFWGAGAYTAFSGGRNVGLQGALGLDFVFPQLPINLSLDWKPELNLSKQFSFEPSAVGFSVRFVF